MAFDGLVVASLADELNRKLNGARITKIAQPEKDAVLLTLKQSTKEDEDSKTIREQFRLWISVSAGLPLMYLTQENKPSPMTAPNFCMVLRKHLNNCRVLGIHQCGFERVIEIDVEHLNEMGDLCQKKLLVELMGKHSNIIFVNEDNHIVDSIKHVSSLVSSVREVLPGKEYFIPNTQEKLNPLTLTEEEFAGALHCKPMPVYKALYMILTGFSPVMANELCHRAGVDSDMYTESLTDSMITHIYRYLCDFMEHVRQGDFTPNILYRGNEPVEFASVELKSYLEQDAACHMQTADSISRVLERYYAEKEIISRMRQKSTELRKIVSNTLERNHKKYDLQLRQLKDTDKRDRYKVYGELLTTYGYSVKPGDASLTCENYYTNEEITIPLDETQTAMENAKRFFAKYNKLKRTHEALTVQIAETKETIEHLDSIAMSLTTSRTEADLAVIKEEIIQSGYMKRHMTGKPKGGKSQQKSKPFHYISSDGYHIYVGKNNFQNDELTFHFATANDWWFHAKGTAGSHVIVKSNGDELPDATFEEAGRLAGYYSKNREAAKVEIDYIEKKHVKKPNGSKPGFVVYYTNYSLMAAPDITGIKEVNE